MSDPKDLASRTGRRSHAASIRTLDLDRLRTTGARLERPATHPGHVVKLVLGDLDGATGVQRPAPALRRREAAAD